MCRDATLEIGEIKVECKSGILESLIDYGVSPIDSKIMGACMQNEYNKVCKSFINGVKVEEVLNQTCIGKTNCSLNIH